MILFVGLGNPGDKYADSRHNVGFMVLDRFANQRRIVFNQHKYDSLLGRSTICGQELILLKPLTYMNLSGAAVLKAVRSLKLTAEQVFVVYDDIDLPLGRVRIRTRGSSAGHNGIKSISEMLQTEEFARMRVGVGRPPEDQDPADYVLESFSQVDRKILDDVINLSAEALFSIVHKGIEKTMSIYNRKTLPVNDE
jgi:peptidyl-tRNA hydrolase, PTH1 family